MLCDLPSDVPLEDDDEEDEDADADAEEEDEEEDEDDGDVEVKGIPLETKNFIPSNNRLVVTMGPLALPPSPSDAA